MRAPTRGPPTMPATTASSSMPSGVTPKMWRRSSTVRCTMRNSIRTRGTLARGIGRLRLPVRLPEEHLHVVEAGQVDDRVDRDLMLQRAGTHSGGAHGPHWHARRE